jgi:hypothetical protein
MLVILITVRKRPLIDTFRKLKNKAIHFGLIVNKQKKYLGSSKKKLISMI